MKEISDAPTFPSHTHPIAVRLASGALIADTFEALVRRVRNEYMEMPGLSFTVPQAQRMWGLRRSDCESLFAALVQTGFLVRTSNGAFLRAGSGRAGA